MRERDGLLSRRQIADRLQQRFYVTQQADSFRTIFSRLDIKWLTMGTDPDSGRGQVAFYDPLVVWVMATYFHWPRLAGSSPHSALRSCYCHAAQRRGEVDDEQTRRLAYYMFIADPRWGLDLRVLDSALASDPGVLELTCDGSKVLKAILLEYKRAVLRGMTGHDVADVRLACDYEAEFVEGYGDVRPDEWPFFGASPDHFFEIMEKAGLYDPSVDPDYGLEFPEMNA